MLSSGPTPAAECAGTGVSCAADPITAAQAATLAALAHLGAQAHQPTPSAALFFAAGAAGCDLAAVSATITALTGVPVLAGCRTSTISTEHSEHSQGVALLLLHGVPARLCQAQDLRRDPVGAGRLMMQRMYWPRRREPFPRTKRLVLSMLDLGAPLKNTDPAHRTQQISPFIDGITCHRPPGAAWFGLIPTQQDHAAVVGAGAAQEHAGQTLGLALDGVSCSWSSSWAGHPTLRVPDQPLAAIWLRGAQSTSPRPRVASGHPGDGLPLLGGRLSELLLPEGPGVLRTTQHDVLMILSL